MKRIMLIATAVLALATLALAQTQHAQAQQTPGSSSQAPGAVQITNGPGVQNLTSTSAEVFWNTNAPSAAVVRYGTSRDKLDQTAEEASGQTSHKVELKNLQPNTTYYFQVDSSQAKGTRTETKSGVGIFKTKP